MDVNDKCFLMRSIAISVIIPTYKPQNYLWECLLSLKNQNLPIEQFEVILVLNGEKEPFFSRICNFIREELGENFNIHLFFSSFGNVSNARNIGIEKANGEYITFIDDDDVVSQNFLQGLLEKSSPNTVAISYTESFTTTTDNTCRGYIITKEYMKCSARGRIPYFQAARFFQGPCMKLFNKEIIGESRFDPNLKNGEDSLFMFLISDRMKYVDFTDQSSVYYRRIRLDGANYSKKPLRYRIKNATYLIKKYCSLFYSHPKKYNLSFFVSRVLGAVKACLLN